VVGGGAVALHDGPIGLPPPLQRDDDVDSGSHRCSPARIDATGHERVKLVQKLPWEPDGYLLRSHSQSMRFGAIVQYPRTPGISAELGQSFTEVAQTLGDPLLILDEREPHVAVPPGTEPAAR
jgi:hypothetical protein